MKNDDISAAAFHRFISQPASGRSSALPLLAAFLVLSLILGKLHLHSLFFRPETSAVIYSIVETAKANGLDVFKYFELLLTVLPSMEFLTNPDILDELMPWNESVQKICKTL